MGEYGRSGPDAARAAFPLLTQALEGMERLAIVEPALEPEMRAAAQTCPHHKRANVRQLAHRLAQI